MRAIIALPRVLGVTRSPFGGDHAVISMLRVSTCARLRGYYSRVGFLCTTQTKCVPERRGSPPGASATNRPKIALQGGESDCLRFASRWASRCTPMTAPNHRNRDFPLASRMLPDLLDRGHGSGRLADGTRLVGGQVPFLADGLAPAVGPAEFAVLGQGVARRPRKRKRGGIFPIPTEDFHRRHLHVCTVTKEAARRAEL
jgi:hypothetical protein